MGNRRWLLPESIADVLPREAAHIEVLRRRLLDEFASYGYELVMPPMLEFVESLLPGIGARSDLDLRTFKLVDQISGRSMGVRADITPQAARIDAHMLNRQGVTRVCYCGSVLHTLPASFEATREPLQIGAELYGHSGLEADIEVVGLLASALRLCGIQVLRLEFGHAAVFNALSAAAHFDDSRAEDVFLALQGKDIPLLRELLATVNEPLRSAFLALPTLQGNVQVLHEAVQVLPALPAITAALADLQRMAQSLANVPGLSMGFDLADLRGYNYHTGVVMAAYCAGSATAVALGGRYDGLGEAYGRARPATGFSMDLREIARLSPHVEPQCGVLAPWPDSQAASDAMHAEVKQLREAGERVVFALPGHDGTWRAADCDRALVWRAGKWIVEPLRED
nr:aTP phosphoribosyltransferase regulatory subunit [uncultured bacterium]QLG20316.1 aTP phosphoribosyltransferase regulatory subunit [uncultured bacterium]QLG20432.1 aTP phosphoribosyltransferase regulatory subunit [uncultured bacterium]QLG20624.1 aTP phosphoribosyltransferase regulatory subunit [uncultured bacterium]QLG20681.1 aTP phosphoribosyltransferase regulatory subunit [uncultured bacterium]